ncbi:MAG: hypothetical protein JW712_04490 [Dehalococcoidales bacterium]|nr:hypothetical protein [Dehalococcoidales bacterium]
MARYSLATKQIVRAEAERFLREYGFIEPPLPPDDALAARKLEVTRYSLDDLLVEANLSKSEQRKVQAMIDIPGKSITFRNNLHKHQKNWGKLHEIGHEFLDWHRQLLYYCPLLYLPISRQEEFESEADIFAAETFFFGSKFTELASKGEFGLHTAKILAEDIYSTSFHSTFMHYVEESTIPCCLCIWKSVKEVNEIGDETHISQKVELEYYIPSHNFPLRFRTKTRNSNQELLSLFDDPSQGIIQHQIPYQENPEKMIYLRVESFCNFHNVFSLVFL